MSNPTQCSLPHEAAFDFVVGGGAPGTEPDTHLPGGLSFTDFLNSDAPVMDNDPQFTISISPEVDYVAQSRQYALVGWLVLTTANSTQDDPWLTYVHSIVRRQVETVGYLLHEQQFNSKHQKLVRAYTSAYDKTRSIWPSDAVPRCRLEEKEARTELVDSFLARLNRHLNSRRGKAVKRDLSRAVGASDGSGTSPWNTYRFRFVENKDGASATAGAIELQPPWPSL